MEYLVTGEMARLIDRFTIDQTGVPSLILMERASLAVAVQVEKLAVSLEHAGEQRILSVCGSGNNGGDGMAAARILWCRGYDVSILLVGNPLKLSEDAGVQLRIARNMGVPVIEADQLKGFEDSELDEDICEEFLSSYDILLDAIFGTGLSREVGGSYLTWIRAINRRGEAGASICAVDIASGVDSDEGRILGEAVRADVTVTFGYRKSGMILFPGAVYSGKVVCEEIGFDPRAMDQFEQKTICYDSEDLALMPARQPDSNKGTYGKVLVIAGSRNMAGAAAFSAKAAYYAGAGLVTVLTPECNRVIIQTLVPEAVLKTYPEEGADTDQLLELVRSHTVTILGPGLGTETASVRIVQEVLGCLSGQPLILDADALNILSEHRDWLKKAGTASRGRIIITPHIKELSRLTGDNIQTLKTNMNHICGDFSRSYGVICIAKDARTRVYTDCGPECEPVSAAGSLSEPIYINVSGNHGMSTGGAGDVLTGVIGGLCAQGLDPAQASRLGVYIHGLAGDRALEKHGAYAVTATAILDGLSGIFAGKQ